EIKSKLVAASEPGVDRSKIQSEISELQNQLTSIAESATFSGENWLSTDSSVAGYSATKSVVASFNRASDGSVSLATIDIDTSTTVLFDAGTGTTEVGLLDTEYTVNNGAATPVAVTYTVSTLDITAANVDDTVLADMISNVDATVEALTTSASDLGTSKKRINLQTTFVGDLMDAIERGIGKLVDADMTEESTRLQALQVQQQLGVQSLSIANGNAQTILSLFR
ncbi:flagellin, partial [Ahrensia marina]